MALPPLPENNTDRLFIYYTSGGGATCAGVRSARYRWEQGSSHVYGCTFTFSGTGRDASVPPAPAPPRPVGLAVAEAPAP